MGWIRKISGKRGSRPSGSSDVHAPVSPTRAPTADLHLLRCQIKSGDSVLFTCAAPNAPGLKAGSQKSKGEKNPAPSPTHTHTESPLKPIPCSTAGPVACAALLPHSRRQKALKGRCHRRSPPSWRPEPSEQEPRPPGAIPGRDPGPLLSCRLCFPSPPPLDPLKLYCELEDGWIFEIR